MEIIVLVFLILIDGRNPRKTCHKKQKWDNRNTDINCAKTKKNNRSTYNC